MRRVLIALIVLALPGLARAEWMQASSPNFEIYADTSAGNIQKFSQELERYHEAMSKVMNTAVATPSPSNRVAVYVVGSKGNVQKLAGGENAKNVAGFYVPRAGASIAIVPSITGGGKDLDFSKIVLLHEYAHHFMIYNTAFAMPRWYSEGGAEFFASAAFESNGDVWVGRAANHRAAEIFNAKDVTATHLLDPDSYTPPKGGTFDAFYGKSWTLFHYLVFDAERKGQMPKYLTLLAQGKTSREAGLEAFGDFKKLESDLDRYLNKSRINAFRLPAAMLNPGATTLRKLSAGEAAIMPVMIRSRRGVTPEQAAEVIIEARAIAKRFPNDPAVLSALAEAEHDSGHDTEAVAAADAALALDKTQVNAYIQKGYALYRVAEKSGDLEAFKKARSPFLVLNKVENDHPIPLIYNYRTQLAEKGQAPKNAVLGLERALQLAPFDLGLRMNVAQQQIRDGRCPLAKANLVPIAFNPHGGGMTKTAQAMIAQIDANHPKCEVLSVIVEPG